MSIFIKSSGSFDKFNAFKARVERGKLFDSLDQYGNLGVSALAAATPKESGETASSWNFRVTRGARPGIEWFNTHIVNGQKIAILIQYGHGTGTGGYVQGRDYINPAIQPIFDQIANDIWKKVTDG